MLVVDASVVVKWFVEEPLHAQARHVYKYQQDIQSPEFVLVEVANVAWKKVQRKEIGIDQALEIIDLASDAIPEFIEWRPLLAKAAELAVELAHPVYDCLYLACANGPNDVLLTGDMRFFNKTRDTRFRSQIRYLDDADLALPLHIPLYEVERIIELSDRLEATHRHLLESLRGEKDFVVMSSSDYQPVLDSPPYRRLSVAIEALSDVEQADILALGWLGQLRSGHDPGEDWEALRRRAAEAIRGADKRYLNYVGSKAVYVEQGLAVLRRDTMPH